MTCYKWRAAYDNSCHLCFGSFSSFVKLNKRHDWRHGAYLTLAVLSWNSPPCAELEILSRPQDLVPTRRHLNPIHTHTHTHTHTHKHTVSLSSSFVLSTFVIVSVIHVIYVYLTDYHRYDDIWWASQFTKVVNVHFRHALSPPPLSWVLALSSAPCNAASVGRI